MTIKINGTNTTAQPSITGTDTDTGLVYGTDEVSIVTGGTDRVTVNNTGLGIGTTSPQRALVVSDAGTEGFEFYPGSSSGGNTLNHYNRATSAFVNITTNADQHIFGRADGEKLRIQSTGGISFNGDTAAANALDDYEEGTWTPTESSGVGLSIGLAKYIKIGHFVYCDLDVTYNQNTTGGNAQITLPFSMIANNEYGSGIAGWASNADGCKLHVGAQVLYLMKLETNSGSGNVHLSPANMSNKRIISSFTYRAA